MINHGGVIGEVSVTLEEDDQVGVSGREPKLSGESFPVLLGEEEGVVEGDKTIGVRL